jgi:di/tricarboxylate transporter
LLVLLGVSVPLASAVMNNIPIVAVLVPIVLALVRDMGERPSRFMIPLSYFAMLGGTCTLIGTGTNLVVNEIYVEWQRDVGQAADGFGLFEFAPLGLIFVAAGLVYLLTLGRALLPERTSLSALVSSERTAQFLTEIQVDSDSVLAGQDAREVFPGDGPVRLIEVVRNEQVLLGGLAREVTMAPGDYLIIEGTSKEITSFLSRTRASLATVIADDRRVPMKTVELALGEAVVVPDSPFIGRRIPDLRLNHHYGIKVLALQRGGRHHRKNLRGTILRVGDVLLLQADAAGFSTLRETGSVLLVEGLERAIAHEGRRIVAIAILLAVLGLGAFTHVPLVVLALAGAALMIAARCLRLDEAARSLDFGVLALLAGTIPLGLAMQQTGLAREIVAGITGVVGQSHAMLVIGALYLVTTIMTSFLSNKATAVLMAPIAIQLAVAVGVDPAPFLVTVCFAASSSFVTPIGYPTNLIVMGPGGYHFSDYTRVGLPLNALLWILATVLIPIQWPLSGAGVAP